MKSGRRRIWVLRGGKWPEFTVFQMPVQMLRPDKSGLSMTLGFSCQSTVFATLCALCVLCG